MSSGGTKGPLVLIGAGGHAVSCANVAVSAGFDVVGFVDDKKAGQIQLERPVISRVEFIAQPPSLHCLIAIGDNFARQRVRDELVAELPEICFPSVIHAEVSVGMYTKIGDGCVVMAGALVGPNTILGDHCIVNSNASIDHDSVLANFASVAPGVTMGGGVVLGQGTAVSIGATVKHGISLGDHVVVGAASYVHENVGDRVVCHGVPARVIRKREPDEPYLS